MGALCDRKCTLPTSSVLLLSLLLPQDAIALGYVFYFVTLVSSSPTFIFQLFSFMALKEKLPTEAILYLLTSGTFLILNE